MWKMQTRSWARNLKRTRREFIDWFIIIYYILLIIATIIYYMNELSCYHNSYINMRFVNMDCTSKWSWMVMVEPKRMLFQHLPWSKDHYAIYHFGFSGHCSWLWDLSGTTLWIHYAKLSLYAVPGNGNYSSVVDTGALVLGSAQLYLMFSCGMYEYG